MAKANVWISANDRNVYTNGALDSTGGSIEWRGWSGDSWSYVASPNDGYVFDHWGYTIGGGPNDGDPNPTVSGETISGSGQYEKKIGDGTSGYTIKVDAYFVSSGGHGGPDGPGEEGERHTLTTSVAPNDKCGEVSPSGTTTYESGEVVSVSARETDSAYEFDHFTVDGSENRSNPITVTMDSDHVVVANFSLNYHGILHSPSAGSIICDQYGNILCI